MGTFFFLTAVRSRNSAQVEQILGRFAEEKGFKASFAKSENDEDWMAFTLQRGEWTCVQFQQLAVDWDRATLELSSRLKAPAFFVQIYDGDAWGYRFFDLGRELAKFVNMPAVVEEASERPEEWKGGLQNLASSLSLRNTAALEKYLVHLDPETPPDGKAYPDDEFEAADPWVLSDFLRKLEIQWEDQESQGSMIYLSRKR